MSSTGSEETQPTPGTPTSESDVDKVSYQTLQRGARSSRVCFESHVQVMGVNRCRPIPHDIANYPAPARVKYMSQVLKALQAV